MKTRSVLLLALLAVPPACAAAGQGGTEASVPRISLADFKKGLASGEVIAIDVRDAESFAAGHIPGSILVPLADIEKKAAGFKGSKKILVAYCA